MSETPCPFCGQIHGTACDSTSDGRRPPMSDATIPAVVQDAQQYDGCSSMFDTKFFDIVFDGPPSHEAGRFVETEDSNRRSVCLGEWVERDDGYWVLRIPAVGDDEAKYDALISVAKAERDALLAEHEAVAEGYGDETADGGCDCLSCRIIRAHDNAERVIHGE